MYSYKKATEVLVAVEKEMMLGNLFQTDALSIAKRLADTIGQWEAFDDQAVKTMARMAETISELTDELAQAKETCDAALAANATFADQEIRLHQLEQTADDLGERVDEGTHVLNALEFENRELKEERDQLIDSNMALSAVIDKMNDQFTAIRSVLNLSD